MKRIITALIITAIAVSTAFAALPAVRINHLRSMAMGDAFSAVANDYSVLFHNPAGIRRTNDEMWDYNKTSIFNIGVGVNKEGVALAKQIAGYAGDGTFDDFGADWVFDNTDVINDLMHAKLGVGLNVIPFQLAFTGDNMAFAMMDQMDMEVQLYRNILPEMRVATMYNMQMKLGYANSADIGPFVLDWGVAIKAIAYTHVDRAVSVGDIPADITSNTMEALKPIIDSAQIGLGGGVDVGAILNFNKFDSPFLKNLKASFVIENFITPIRTYDVYEIATTVSDGGDFALTEKEPELMRPNVQLGASYFLAEIGPIPKDLLGNLIVAVDFAHIGDPDYGSLGEWIHMGAEVKALKVFSVRVGLNQGYPTYGIGINAGPLDINYAFYQEELGADLGVMPSSRHLVNFGFRW